MEEDEEQAVIGSQGNEGMREYLFKVEFIVGYTHIICSLILRDWTLSSNLRWKIIDQSSVVKLPGFKPGKENLKITKNCFPLVKRIVLKVG